MMSAAAGETTYRAEGYERSHERPRYEKHARYEGPYRRDAYATAGRGEALLLLHGWPFTWYTWRLVVPALARHYTIIMPDLRGIG
jgi:pimeloyl-ACP methyl ester carboxylesterase